MLWKDKYEIIFVGPNQILVKSISSCRDEISVISNYGGEIDDVQIMGKDNYLVARTNTSLIVVDIQRKLSSEVNLLKYILIPRLPIILR